MGDLCTTEHGVATTASATYRINSEDVGTARVVGHGVAGDVVWSWI